MRAFAVLQIEFGRHGRGDASAAISHPAYYEKRSDMGEAVLIRVFNHARCRSFCHTEITPDSSMAATAAHTQITNSPRCSTLKSQAP